MADDYAPTIDAAQTAQDRRAGPWLALLDDAARVFGEYERRAERIDRLYANLAAYAEHGLDRELQIFWANIEVLRPITYSRAPAPVVTPRFRDRRPLPRAAADIVERALIGDVEADDMHSTLLAVRDDMIRAGRGVAWVRYGLRDGMPAALCEHIERCDFRHAPARKWAEVDWVARRAYLTKRQGYERFGEVFRGVQCAERALGAGENEYHGEALAEVWEIWHRPQNAVVWVSPGAAEVLDIQPPAVNVAGYFPCPKPAFTTLQPGTLIPVPDIVYYRDQLEEINELTRRISALSEALRVKGFYAGGARDVAEALEAAMASTDDRQIMVPVANLAALGGAKLTDSILFLPIEVIVATIRECMALRREAIELVYQVTGISDIMRGETQASETLGAQQLKTQYGGVRIRAKQEEMVRVARDVVRLKAEILAETAPIEQLLEMAQIDNIPTAADIQMQMQQMQIAARQQMMQAQAAAQQGAQIDPAMIDQAAQQFQAQMAQLQGSVTVDAVAQLLADQKLRPFVLEIETDSTIQPDEQAEKQRRIEFLTAVGGFMQQAFPLVQAFPPASAVVAEFLTFVAGGFRAGRQMEMAIDEFAETLRGMSQQPQQPQPDPRMIAAEGRIEVDKARLALEQQRAQADVTLRAAELAARSQQTAGLERAPMDGVAA